MALPRKITLTGVDDSVDPARLADISMAYPNVEWGILFSPKLQGVGRYPSLAYVRRLLAFNELAGMSLSAHLCGAHSKQLIGDGSLPPSIDRLIEREHFDRVQINTIDPMASPPRLGNWARQRGMRAIMQCRNSTVFPGDDSVDWLFDQSGGRGIEAQEFPFQAVPGRLSGYAGGIGPDNVMGIVSAIQMGGADTYWIDMETSLRDGKDHFDLTKCWAVCREVYGGIFD